MKPELSPFIVRLTPEDIKALRQSFGLSKELFARAIGVSLGCVDFWERGKRSPGPTSRRRLSEMIEFLLRQSQNEETKIGNEWAE